MNTAKDDANISIEILPENKIDRSLLKKPDKRGNAFIFRSDGTPVEIYHLEQSVDGPYVEMHRYDHRGKDNHKVNHPKLGQGSQIDRKQFAKQKLEYWEKEYDK